MALNSLYPIRRVKIRKKDTFEKGYTPRWTEEVFSIDEVLRTDPSTYKIRDYNDERIQGSFYEPELQKTSQYIFRIEKVIRKRGNKALVKWLGYHDSFNSWTDSKDVIKGPRGSRWPQMRVDLC